MATLLSPDMLPEDIRNMDFGQASMPHAPEAQTPEVPYDTTTSAPDRPAIPLSPDMLSGNLRGNDSEKSGIEFSFDAFGYTQQVELVQESYADGNLAVTAYLSYPAFTFDTEVMGNMRDLNEFVSADHSSLAEMRGACHAALENVYGSEFTDALESGYDLNAESHDCASGSAVLETCDTTRAEQPMNHVKGVR